MINSVEIAIKRVFTYLIKCGEVELRWHDNGDDDRAVEIRLGDDYWVVQSDIKNNLLIIEYDDGNRSEFDVDYTAENVVDAIADIIRSEINYNE